ncbi:hypothetical protein BHAOGJBA_5118 [Methylobacterium hispanicum]|uniref:Uncharacterized protein n=1 Tax=Methylobacterium hispanicum TaxID=270350 RepID=A0AAV4ZU95_9HYPH|nr:hypothetical protein [Methylobacterium hispanicum]GJD91570.1 hypothetical protein BHAOGJBA_5118 [Methylobacterium hispanicum]
MPRQPLIDVEGPGPNTRISWTYTDGSNHKHTHRSVYAGRISVGQAAVLVSKLTQGGEFVPADVGMSMLQLVVNGFWHPTLDHAWHTLDAVEVSRESPDADTDLVVLVERWAALKEWDPDAAEEKLSEELGPPPDQDDEEEDADEPASPAPAA